MAGWIGPAIMGASMLGSAAMGTFGKKDSVSQIPLETPEQTKARQMLLKMVETGQLPTGEKLGAAYTGSLGNYDMTAMESTGQSKLMDMLNSGNPELFNIGQNEIKKLLSDDSVYDPYAKGSLYTGFKDETLRALEEGKNRLKQNSAFARNLYSTNTGKEMGLLEERGQKSLEGKLAELYQNFVSQKQAAIPLALQAGTAENTMNLNKVGASQQYGALARILQDQMAKDKYAEFQRQQQEKMQVIPALTSAANKDAQFGVKDVSVPSAWNKVLDSLTYLGGQMIGKYNWGGNGTADSSASPSSFNGGSLNWRDPNTFGFKNPSFAAAGGY